jgi:hypothetical protein
MATLIDVATPGPALNLSKTAQAYAASTLYGETPVTETLANTVYQLDSISITAGTWVVVGVTSVLYVTQTNYLNLVTATGSNSWPVQVTASSATTNMAIAAVIKVTGTTTIYLNGKNTNSGQAAGAAMFAVQIA